MKSSIRLLHSGILLSVLLSSPPDARSQRSGAATAPSVIFGTVAGDRGSLVGIPVYFKAGKEKVRSISMAVDFISNSVKFDRADATPGASGQNLTLTVQAEDIPPGANKLPRTRLKIAAFVPDNAASDSLPDGLWTFLNFQVSPDAKPFAISLQLNSIAALSPASKPVVVSTEPGKVIVSGEDETMVGCFFFTH